MKHEWKKSEKQFYAPKNQPEIIHIPEFKFFTIQGQGNPNDPSFADYIGVLYKVSYALKMNLKKELIQGATDYVVYPLEGVWDLTEKGRQNYKGEIDKNELVFKLMIRQPDFVSQDFALHMVEKIKKTKPHPLCEAICFECITEGICIQSLHLGSYDNEQESFRQMELFAGQHQYSRTAKVHREIYLSDARKTPVEKLRTILRFQVKGV